MPDPFFELFRAIPRTYNPNPNEFFGRDDLQHTGVYGVDGRELLRNANGSYSTEFTITAEDPRINSGMPTVIPSIYGGQFRPDEAVDIIAKHGGIDPETGLRQKGFSNIPIAEKAAMARHNDIDLQNRALGIPEKAERTYQSGFAYEGPKIEPMDISQIRSVLGERRKR